MWKINTKAPLSSSEENNWSFFKVQRTHIAWTKACCSTTTPPATLVPLLMCHLRFITPLCESLKAVILALVSFKSKSNKWEDLQGNSVTVWCLWRTTTQKIRCCWKLTWKREDSKRKERKKNMAGGEPSKARICQMHIKKPSSSTEFINIKD